MDGKTILAFLLGTVTGAAGTYVCLREATERYISNEIQAFKEEWAETHKTPENGVYEATEASQEGSEDEPKANMTKSSLEEGRKQAQAIIKKRNYATALPENDQAKISEEEIEQSSNNESLEDLMSRLQSAGSIHRTNLQDSIGAIHKIRRGQTQRH